MTWDTREPRSQAKPNPSAPNGWDGPGWWSDGNKTADKPVSSVRSTDSNSVRRPSSVSVGGPAKGSTSGRSGSRTDGALAATRAAGARPVSRPRPRSNFTLAKLVVGFVVGTLAALLLAAAAVLALSGSYDGKILPGVHAGTVDLSGLTRDQAAAAIDTAYTSVGQGTIAIKIPAGTEKMTYAQAGRAIDSAAMADAAIAIGHGGDPLSTAAATIRTFTDGAQVPVMIKIDPTAIATVIHGLTQSSLEPPKDAAVTTKGTDFAVVPGAPGRGLDEVAIQTEIIDQLFQVDAPNNLSVGGDFVTVQPNVTDAQAQAAIESAGKMAVDVNLTSGDTSWKIDAKTVRSWILFGPRTDGTYGPVVDPQPVATWVATLTKAVNVTAVEPRVTYTAGKPTGLSDSKPGVALDVNATAQAIETYVDGLGSGGATPSAGVALVTTDVQPKVTDPGLDGFVVIGSVVTTYFPGESNGNGTNISLPAQLMNGQVVAPGDQFSMLQRVGPIDAAHGWKLGGVIIGGVSNHTGAMGGGICSASTTMFQAAALAGLQITERHAHFYWIDRYTLNKTVGLDATVYSNGTTTWDMRWTNDTPYPVVIRSWTAGSSKVRTIHVELWSKPNGRKTVFSTAVVTDQVKATKGTQYVPSLPAGQKTYNKEYATDGFNAFVTRTVTDPTGAVVHYDEFYSHYTKVDGILQIAGTPGPSHTPTPTPGPATPVPPAATPGPATPVPTAPAPTAAPPAATPAPAASTAPPA